MPQVKMPNDQDQLEEPHLETMVEQHPLAPFLPLNARLLMLGSFPPPRNRWKMDFYYPNFQNDMWRIFGVVFFDDKNYFIDLNAKTFKRDQIEAFLVHTGIAIFDTAVKVRRLKNNAADRFLHIEQVTDLNALLKQIPNCQVMMTTGDKATETMMLSMPEGTDKPSIGQFSSCIFAQRELHLYRMPSSSRAYPLSLQNKAAAYRQFFQEIGLL